MLSGEEKTAMYTDHTKKISLEKDHREDLPIAGKTKPDLDLPLLTLERIAKTDGKNVSKRNVQGSE